jgi:hypothetical protein
MPKRLRAAVIGQELMPRPMQNAPRLIDNRFRVVKDDRV